MDNNARFVISQLRGISKKIVIVESERSKVIHMMVETCRWQTSGNLERNLEVGNVARRTKRREI